MWLNTHNNETKSLKWLTTYWTVSGEDSGTAKSMSSPVIPDSSNAADKISVKGFWKRNQFA